ncbi:MULTISPECIES: hypothetical protein [Sphingobacterium]|uniref:Outer membrane protein beta-barrel domain-containing protein n=2 Tax=Sphingobacterium TaxID=28453 RepID=A0A4Q6XEH4_9SPHI|nr:MULTISPECIES: hypothetical protein [Sphingobacterium]MBD1434004.1 hypothetical protein [Sphingobacterium micropteri]RZF58240.1 hypothetical protein EWE74_19520 [Sphingobacterium corticibacterium]
MRKITLAFVAVLFAAGAFAQDYKNSIGIRFGSGDYDLVSAAFKTFLNNGPGALEFDLGFRTDKSGDRYFGNQLKWTNVSLSGAYQHHFPIPNVEGFKWFVGGGAVLSNTFVSGDYDIDGGFNAGIFPTGGVDYKLKNAPFAFSADVRPTFHIVNGYDYYSGFYFNGGLTARYTF